ncbi:hypothetical protein SEA_BRUHMOMENT_97 [Arthrobacter phage BruhMoment]|nr:hypothetical protein SEA_BRUHMOMENT_97 [Arthrobacter phage BruhMoment]
MSQIYIHLANTLDWREAACGYVMTLQDKLPTGNHSAVTCPACLNIVEQRKTGDEFAEGRRTSAVPSQREKMRRDWTVACVAGDTELGFTEWMREELGGSEVRPLHQPPKMNEIDDGIFRFYDVDWNAAHPLTTRMSMEVVPQTTGNVEITLDADGNADDLMITLSHLDRMDLVRALLHDFHYSPERGGPHDDND